MAKKTLSRVSGYTYVKDLHINSLLNNRYTSVLHSGIKKNPYHLQLFYIFVHLEKGKWLQIQMQLNNISLKKQN